MGPLLQSFSSVFGALAPIFALIALGHVLKRTGFPGEGFWAPAERLTYFILFPCLLLNNLAKAPLAGLPVPSMAGGLITAFLAAAALLVVLRQRLGVDGPGFTSVFQGGVRMNTYAGIAGAVALYGDVGLTLAAVAIAVIIPMVNVLSVSVLYRYASREDPGWGRVLGGVVRNPLILACAAGIFLNATGLGLPFGIGGVLEILGRASLTIGLLAVGAGLEPRHVGIHGRALLASSAVKLLVLPVLVAVGCRSFGVTGPATAIAVLFSALPSSASSYILARQLGGDSRLMASILTLQTGLAAVTLPLALVLLG